MATQPVVLDWPFALLFLLVAVVVIIATVFAALTALAVLIGLTVPQARGEGLGPGAPPS